MKLIENKEALEYFEFKKNVKKFIEDLSNIDADKENLFFTIYFYDKLQEFMLNKYNFSNIKSIFENNEETEGQFNSLVREVFNKNNDDRIVLNQISSLLQKGEKQFITEAFKSFLRGNKILFLDSSYFIFNWKIKAYVSGNTDALSAFFECASDIKEVVEVKASIFQSEDIKDFKVHNSSELFESNALYNNSEKFVAVGFRFWDSKCCDPKYVEGTKSNRNNYWYNRQIQNIKTNATNYTCMPNDYFNKFIEINKNQKDFKFLEQKPNQYILSLVVPKQTINEIHRGLPEEKRSIFKIHKSNFMSLDNGERLEKLENFFALILLNVITIINLFDYATFIAFLITFISFVVAYHILIEKIKITKRN